MLVLGIETSCDETAVAVYDRQRGLLAHRIYSQVATHAPFGGVVPELASRDHVRKLLPLVEQALADAGAAGCDLDAVAYTAGPGLIGALLVGATLGTGLAAVWGIPAIPVHHMEAHLLAPLLEAERPQFPFVALLVSGGHSMLVAVAGMGRYRILGQTLDDAAGEAFDKTAKLLGLPYPGGRHIERLAAEGDPTRFKLPRPMLHGGQRVGDPDYYDVSFSGLKTAVLLAVRASDDLARDTPHIARGFQDALIDTLVAKTIRAARAHGRSRIVLGGGVACNKTLVAAMRTAAAPLRATVYAPTPRLATDNAAMIGAAALYRYGIGQRDGAELNAHSGLPLPGLLVDPAPTA